MSGEHYGSVRYVDDSKKEAQTAKWLQNGADAAAPQGRGDKPKGSRKVAYDVPLAMVDQVHEALNLEHPMDDEDVRDAIRKHDYDIDAVISALQAAHVTPPAHASAPISEPESSPAAVGRKGASKEIAKTEKQSKVEKKREKKKQKELEKAQRRAGTAPKDAAPDPGPVPAGAVLRI